MLWLVAVLVIILAAILYLVGKYNHIISLGISCEEAISTVDVFLKKRFDLVPSVIEVIKEHTEDNEFCERIKVAASNGQAAQTVMEREEADNELSLLVKEVFELGEKDKSLHSKSEYLELLGYLRALKQDIANAKINYNECAREYNKTCRMFPGNIISSMFKFEIKCLFKEN